MEAVKYIQFGSEKKICGPQKGIVKMKKFSADMKVVRFGAEDVIVTSGAPDMVFDEKMGDKYEANGTVTFDGKPYLLNDSQKLYDICDAITRKYAKDGYETTIGDNGTSLQGLLVTEIWNGLGPGWVGSYKYDAASNKFTRQ